jgi:AIR synthase-related protein
VRLEPGSLPRLVGELRARVELAYKKDVQLPARLFGKETASAWYPSARPIVNGDDAAALPDGDEYLLFAAEGIRGELVAADPWFAGFCSILTNVNDIAAMGGRPWAVVDVLFLGSGQNERVLEGMAAASALLGVPVVGGHTSRTTGASMLAVAVVGRARRCLPSAGARPGHALLAAIALDGSFRGPGGNFNAASAVAAPLLRARLGVLPALAEAGLVAAAKDISMAGICGTLVMMLEASGCGARLELGRIPAPSEVDPMRWLTAFPSFGFLLAVEPSAVSSVRARFDEVGVACAAVGEITGSRVLELSQRDERQIYWDLKTTPFTGFGV